MKGDVKSTFNVRMSSARSADLRPTSQSRRTIQPWAANQKIFKFELKLLFKNQTKLNSQTHTFTDTFGDLSADRVAPLGIRLVFSNQEIWSKTLEVSECSSILVAVVGSSTVVPIRSFGIGGELCSLFVSRYLPF